MARNLSRLICFPSAVFTVLCLLLAAAFAPYTNAQELPTRGPLVAKVPEFAQWTVSFQYPGESSPGKASDETGKPKLVGLLRRERVARTKDLLRIVREYDGAPKEECWVIQGIQWASHGPSEPPIPALNVQSRYFRGDIPLHHFPEFGWVQHSFFIGVQKFSGKECFVFQKSDRPNAVTSAYIDSQTRLPVCLSSPDAIRSYSFGPAPEVLTIPREYAKAIAEENEQTAKAMKPGAR